MQVGWEGSKTHPDANPTRQVTDFALVVLSRQNFFCVTQFVFFKQFDLLHPSKPHQKAFLHALKVGLKLHGVLSHH